MTLKHNRYLNMGKESFEHLMATEKMKPTAKQKKFLWVLNKKCEENNISTTFEDDELFSKFDIRNIKDLKTRRNYKHAIDVLLGRLIDAGLWGKGDKNEKETQS